LSLFSREAIGYLTIFVNEIVTLLIEEKKQKTFRGGKTGVGTNKNILLIGHLRSPFYLGKLFLCFYMVEKFVP